MRNGGAMLPFVRSSEGWGVPCLVFLSGGEDGNMRGWEDDD
jgi:hypothetical protein